MSRPDNSRRFSIGLYAGPSPVELAPVPEVPHPVLTGSDVNDLSAHSVADPFVLRHDGVWHLFFQASNGETDRGEIALALSEDLRSWDVQGPVLTEPEGVAYPHIVCCRGEIYMVPEVAGQNAVRLYRAEEFPRRWRPVATLLDGVSARAATPFHHGDSWWMFVATTDAGPESHDELRLYRADELTGPWEEHPASPVVHGDRGDRGDVPVRPAGRVVDSVGGPIRFAHDAREPVAAMAAMAAMAAFEITTLNPDDYAERPLGCPLETPPAGAWGCSGLHHVDAHRLADGAWIALVAGDEDPSGRD